MKLLLLLAVVASASAFSTAEPELCDKVTCDTIKTHTCHYHHNNFLNDFDATRSCANGINCGDERAGMFYDNGDKCSTHHPDDTSICNGDFQWYGKKTNNMNSLDTCTGSSSHRSMRIHHHNLESNCAGGDDQDDPSRSGAVCGIGIVTGKADCECRPRCSDGWRYVGGTCRTEAEIAVYSDSTSCTCANGTEKTSGCFDGESGVDSCESCDPGFELHRVSTTTSRGLECIAGTSRKANGQRDVLEISKGCFDGQYQPDLDSGCVSCASTKYTHGGYAGHRTRCSDCPDGYTCNGGDSPTICPAHKTCSGGVMTGDCDPVTQYARAGSSTCTTCAAGSVPNRAALKCDVCPAGHKDNGLGECTPCPAGTYQNAAGQTNCHACNAAAGEWSPEGAKECQDLRPRYYLTGDPLAPEVCPAGSRCGGGASGKVACGDYEYAKEGSAACSTCRGRKLVGKIDCVACPSGKHCDNDGQVHDACPVHTQWDQTAGTCQACPASYYTPVQDAGCKACSPYQLADDDNLQCVACAPTQYFDTSSKTCKACTAGNWCTGAKQIPCPKGTYSSGTSGVCTKCTGNEYASGTGTELPATADEGEWTDGKTKAGCPAGYRCPGDGQKYQCGAGEYSTGDATECSTCGTEIGKDNEYSTGSANTGCSVCPVRHYTWPSSGKHTHCFGCAFNKDGASEVGYSCDGTSEKTACTVVNSTRVVGTCNATVGNAANDLGNPDAADIAACAASTTEAECVDTSVGYNDGCTWLPRTLHKVQYSEADCAPQIRTYDFDAQFGCPVCSIEGSAIVTMTAEEAAGSWTDPGFKCDAGVTQYQCQIEGVGLDEFGNMVNKQIIVESASGDTLRCEPPKNEDGSFQKNQNNNKHLSAPGLEKQEQEGKEFYPHAWVITYVAKNADGKFNYACNNPNTYTRYVTV